MNKNNNSSGVEAEEKPISSKRTAFIVGLGQSGRELVLRLQDACNVVAIDMNNEKIELLKGKVNESVRLLSRDGTSRITWQDLKIDPEDIVIAITRRDDVNLEICRIAEEHFGVKRRYSVSNTLSRLEDFHQAGIETISRPNVVAASMGSLILQDHKPAVNIGLGAGEIVQVKVLKNSVVVGKKLKSFRAHPWLVAAVYREGKLIVPHGDTVIHEDDQVVLVGDPHILPTVADFFRVGDAEFPLQFGSRIALVLWDKAPVEPQKLLEESYYMIDHSRSRGIVVVTSAEKGSEVQDFARTACDQARKRCVMLPLAETRSLGLSQLLETRDTGCLVLSYPGLGILQRLGLRKHFLTRLLMEGAAPLLIARGTFPYKKILLPVEIDSQPIRAAELAIDLARLFNSELTAVTVTPPAFSVGKDEIEEQKKVLTQVEKLCALYRVPVRVRHLEGNPIREVVKASSEFQLVMLGYGQKRRRVFNRLDLSLEILHRVPCSVMMLPYSGEAR